jgi:hypothetical protein
LQSSEIISITSHSNTLSFTRPQDIPGRSFACCMPFSCRARSPAAPVAGAGGMFLLRGQQNMYVAGAHARGVFVRGLEQDAENLNS